MVFVLVELRTPVPLIKVRIFKDRAFFVDNAVLFFSMVAFVPVFFFASVYSQVSLGYDANNAGLYLLVFFAGFAPAAQVGGRILDKTRRKAGHRRGQCARRGRVRVVGLEAHRPEPGRAMVGHRAAGAGIGLLLGPASTDATNRAINASYGEVTGITQTVRNYGSALGLAVLGTVLGNVFANRLTDSFAGFGDPRRSRPRPGLRGGQRSAAHGGVLAALPACRLRCRNRSARLSRTTSPLPPRRC